jgi:uncharacterized protein (TIGR03435 family)
MSLIKDAYVRFADGRMGSPMLPSLAKIEGGPAWLDSDEYTIEAEADRDVPNAMMAGPMMQALLVDRFQLKIRKEIRNDPVYELSVAKDGSKIQPAKAGPCVEADFVDTTFPSFVREDLLTSDRQCRLLQNSRKGPDLIIVARSMSMEDITENLSMLMDRPVIDRTSITGNVDFRLLFGPDDRTPGVRTPPSPAGATLEDPTGPSIFTALLKQLGLNLKPASSAREHFVIDSVSRPSPN